MSIVRDVAELLFGTDVGEFGARRRVWAARRAKPTPSASALVGQRVKIAGVAQAIDATTPAPFTRRPAIVYRTRMLEKFVGMNAQGTQETTWKTAINEGNALPFVIQDESGSVFVDPRSALIVLDDAEVNEHPFVNDDNQDFRAYLRRRGVLSTMYMGIAGEHLFFESVIAPGDPIAVWGQVAETAGVASAGYRDAAMRTKMIVGTPIDPVVLLRA